MQRNALRVALPALALAALMAVPAHAGPASSYGVQEQVNAPFTMADGTTLVGSVYYPADPATGERAAGRFPVLVTMTPYGSWDGNSHVSPHLPNGGSDDSILRFFAQHGYIGLEVDSRGSGRSEGLFTVLDPQQSVDYVQVIDIAAHHLSGSNGVVGLTGMSYRGLNQLLVGGLLRPGTPVKAMAPASAGASVFDDPFVQGGIASQFWYAYPGILGVSAAPPADQDAAPGGADPRLATVAADRARSAHNLSDMVTQTLSGGPIAYRDGWWQQREPIHATQAIVDAGIPVLLTTGTTDFFPRGAFRMYTALQSVAHGGSPYDAMNPGWKPDRRFQLVYGKDYTDGDFSFWLSYELQWYDHWLKGKANGVASSDRTLHLQDQLGRWSAPPRGTYPMTQQDARLYLDDGSRLSASRPTSATRLPELPWQPETTSLTFTGPPYAQGATVDGPVTVSLSMRSTTPQVELIAQLNDVAPDGTVTTAVPGFEVDGDLAGTLRAVDPGKSWYGAAGTLISPHHPYSRASERTVPIGTPQRYDLELHPRVWSLAPGHRLQLVLSSQSNRLVPTLPQLRALAGGTYSFVAGQSWLTVPVLPPHAFPVTADPTTTGLR
ncbi:MAG: peptidase [Frankiales bacterium]|jgi:putative CocE/NonD family hydrolase|nr:peptidase [Frankiales bacterium]